MFKKTTYICLEKNPKKRYSLKEIHGDCLEGEPINLRMSGGYAILDKAITPEVGDLVHCLKITGATPGYIKRVVSIDPKTGIYTVGTCYIDKSRDFTFEAAEIIGVVLEVYDKMTRCRIYKRSEVKRCSKAEQ